MEGLCRRWSIRSLHWARGVRVHAGYYNCEKLVGYRCQQGLLVLEQAVSPRISPDRRSAGKGRRRLRLLVLGRNRRRHGRRRKRERFLAVVDDYVKRQGMKIVSPGQPLEPIPAMRIGAALLK